MKSDAATRTFVVSIAKATAQARIGGKDQDFEKSLVIGKEADGQLVVRAIGLVGKQGGSIHSEAGDVVAHLHYYGLHQPPHAGDSSAAKAGHPSFVIGHDGAVWEVGKNAGTIQIRSVGANGHVGAWENYEVDPAKYKLYHEADDR